MLLEVVRRRVISGMNPVLSGSDETLMIHFEPNDRSSSDWSFTVKP
jgi:hypothetical protein